MVASAMVRNGPTRFPAPGRREEEDQAEVKIAANASGSMMWLSVRVYT
jgi:hypothetical protein